MLIWDLDKFYIAGGFGSFIDKESAAAIGLIPREVLDKVTVIGNGAGAGACMLLLNCDLIKESEIIADSANTMELSSDEFFMNSYMENMMGVKSKTQNFKRKYDVLNMVKLRRELL